VASDARGGGVTGIHALFGVAGAEVRRAWRHGVTRTVLAAGLVLSAVVVVVGSVRESAWESARDAHAATADAQWHAQPDRHPHRVVHFGDFVFKPPQPFAVIDWGVEAHAGRAVFLEGHRQNPANFAEARESAGLLGLGALDPARYVTVVVPLLMLFAGAGAVASERRDGTWLHLQLSGVGATRILFGKALATWGLGLLLAAPVLLAAAGIGLGSGETGRGLALSALYAGHLAIVALAVVGLSALAREPATALLLGVMVWCLAVLVGPRAAATAAALRHPAPSPVELDVAVDRALRAIGDAHDPDAPHFARFREETLRRHGVDRVEDLPLNWGGLVMLEGERLGAAAIATLTGRQFDAQRAQDAAMARWGIALPSLAVERLSRTLAGTDGEAHRRFLRAAEHRRYIMVQQLNRLHAERILLENDRAQRLDASHWGRIARDDGALRPGYTAIAPGLVVALVLWLGGGAAGLALVGRRLERRPC
jgi:ABC-2 type transport system permease protein